MTSLDAALGGPGDTVRSDTTDGTAGDFSRTQAEETLDPDISVPPSKTAAAGVAEGEPAAGLSSEDKLRFLSDDWATTQMGRDA